MKTRLGEEGNLQHLRKNSIIKGQVTVRVLREGKSKEKDLVTKDPGQENIRHKEATHFNKLIPLIIKYSKEQTYFKTSSPLSI